MKTRGRKKGKNPPRGIQLPIRMSEEEVAAVAWVAGEEPVSTFIRRIIVGYSKAVRQTVESNEGEAQELEALLRSKDDPPPLMKARELAQKIQRRRDRAAGALVLARRGAAVPGSEFDWIAEEGGVDIGGTWLVVKNGTQFGPAPFHHESLESAKEEAERLAAKEGADFHIFQRVGRVTRERLPLIWEPCDEAIP